MPKDKRINPQTAPLAQIRALPFLMEAIFCSCNPELCEAHRRYSWEQGVRRLARMEQL